LLNKNKYLETIKALNGKCYNLKYHEQRSGIKNIISYLNPPKDGLYRCRLIYINDRIEVTYHKYEKRIIKSLELVYDDNISYTKKSTDRKELDKLFTLRNGCDDILIVKNHLLTDTTIANIALYKKDRWYTPKSPLLKGTTRQRFIEEGFLTEIDIKVSDINKFSKIALLNAMINFDIITDRNIREIIRC